MQSVPQWALCYKCYVKLPHNGDAKIICLFPRACMFLLIWRTMLHSLMREVERKKSYGMGSYPWNHFLNKDCLVTFTYKYFWVAILIKRVFKPQNRQILLSDVLNVWIQIALCIGIKASIKVFSFYFNCDIGVSCHWLVTVSIINIHLQFEWQ